MCSSNGRRNIETGSEILSIIMSLQLRARCQMTVHKFVQGKMFTGLSKVRCPRSITECVYTLSMEPKCQLKWEVLQFRSSINACTSTSAWAPLHEADQAHTHSDMLLEHLNSRQARNYTKYLTFSLHILLTIARTHTKIYQIVGNLTSTPALYLAHTCSIRNEQSSYIHYHVWQHISPRDIELLIP